MSMAQAMTTIPNVSCYTFDFVRGRLCEPSGKLWFAHNPDYDPGPPPPPKLPEPPKASGVTITGAETTTAGYHGASSASPVPSRFISSPAVITRKRPYVPLSPRARVPRTSNPRIYSGSQFPESTRAPASQPHTQPHFPKGSEELSPGKKRPRRWRRPQPQGGASG